ncbi:TPA: asparagine synthase (glutamine-hydrolyzing) [Candidatus Dependentiae bacterium]|nr:MAG: Asparagine synthetase [candidate division TM6 bacterium GW2011_GWE2_31_21]KKP54104.1 MAG: Asparagine synthetase [candidate division TM6 bacterium GW2011_GWF2_33_332]HBS48314.1 asparagine synthase (glutamine-hydrolyzing) [Candidatus Dependentiae bacterium]HBZ73012.1 asparagine synthase (glutamine-hydrolyzing) [Candidatus Dependentiae bacterium]
MCGIAGYLNLTRQNFKVEESVLNDMQTAIAHRGPDGIGLWKDDNFGIGFVHRRLSIIDLSDAGNQPMMDAEKTIVICFNGEIYNYQQIRKELQNLGYKFISNSDTEVLIYAYKNWGIDFIKKLEGIFAIALFDLHKNEFYLIRDNIGVKPVYFSNQNGVFAFASEIKALWQISYFSKEINDLGLYHYLTFLVSPAPMTLYKNVYKLPAGFYIKIDCYKKVEYHKWYSAVIAGSREYKNEKFCQDELHRLLFASIKKQMIADVPVGVFLSGGVDSSLNVALMSQFSNNLKTFNVVFEDGLEFDERSWAKKVADKFGTNHHEKVISEKEAFDAFSNIVYHQDEPLADWVCIPLYFVSKLARENGITVVQIGEGADELFSGYGSYANFVDFYKKWWQPTQKHLPKIVRQFLYRTASPFLRSQYSDYLRNLAYDRSLFWGGAVAFRESAKKNLFLKSREKKLDPICSKIYQNFDLGFDSYNVVDYHLSEFKKLDPSGDFLKSMIYLEFQNRLPELLLMRADKMTMAHSLEGRVPFLDKNLVEFGFAISSDLKYKNGITKYILKKVAEKHLPHDLIYRKKIGFAAPVKYWLSKGKYFKPYFESVLQDKNNFWRQYINFAEVQKLFAQHIAGKKDLSPQLWLLLNLFEVKI